MLRRSLLRASPGLLLPASARAFIHGAVPPESITVNTPAPGQGAGVSYTYTGGYFPGLVGTPTALDYQFNSLGWNAAVSPTIGGGTWSFAANTPAAGVYTLSVRDHNHTSAVGTSASFTVVVSIIPDDDLTSDPDAGTTTLPMLYGLKKANLVNILAMTVDSASQYGAPFINVCQQFLGAPYNTIPIGAYQGNATSNNAGNYQQVCVDFGAGSDNRTNYTPAVTLMRTQLAALTSPCILVCTGFLQNCNDLLNSPADGISPLNGSQMMLAKVLYVVVMGGDYPTGSGEYNFGGGPLAAVSNFFANCPVPIYGVGFTMGNTPVCGLVSDAAHATDPFQDVAFQAGTLTRPTWDAQALLFAALGLSPNFQVVGANGTETINIGGNSYSWSSSPTGNSSYLGKLASDTAIQNVINAFIATISA